DRTGDRPLWLGSVKSNLGHTQAAAGVAGVIKMVAAMQHGRLPKTLHAETPSSHVDWSSGEVELLTEPREWPCGERPRRAGVSAFGVSGTNAHAIIEEAPLPEGRAEAGQAAQTDEAADAAAPEVHLPLVPWVVSAKTASGVAAQAGRLLAAVDGHRTVDVGLSLGATRTGLEHRAIVLGGDAEELRTQLAALAAGERVPGMARTGLTGFVFAGQGGQRLGMGRELAAVFPVFAAALDEVCAGFDGLLDRPLREVMFADADADADAAAEVLGRTGWAQPALFAVEVALFRLVESVEEVAPLLVEGVSVAAVNAPGQVVLSGERAAVEAVAARLPERRGRWLQVSHAFHSALMDPMLAEFGRVADGIEMRRPEMPIVSTLTGELIEEFSASYWADQVRGTVRFADAITRLKSLGVARFVTLGPDAGLVGAVEETYGDETLAVSLLGRDRPEPHTAVTALARLWVDGGPVDWAAFYAPTGARTVDLPTYAFQRSRYWPRPRTVEQDAPHGVDADLWNAIERGDAEALAAELGVDLQSPMDEVLPALSAWRRRHEERASLDRLRYQVSWTPVGLDPAPVAVTAGGLLLVESAGASDGWADALAGELASRGVRVERLRLGAADLGRAGLAERFAEFSGCGTVVSFLGQDEAGHSEHVGVPLGLVGTVALVQAVADAGLDVRVWCVTSGAVSVVSGEGLRHPLRAGVWGLGRVVALEE
uniref:acyltransferase domain-containing protein n=1 Tax=Streptomyces sp. NRRL F-5639 TaxID=1463867 RepID=UPI00056A0374